MDNDLIKVISLDPGGTTGWAKGLIREGRMGAFSGQYAWDHLGLYDHLMLFHPHFIVCERFDYRKGGKKQEGVELVSREYIGVITLYAQQMNLTCDPGSYKVRLFMQMPSEGVGGYWAEDKKLKADGMFNVGKPHANDAMRHLLQWFTFKEGYQFNKDGFYRMDANEST